MGTRREEGGREEAEEEERWPQNDATNNHHFTGLWDHKENKDIVDKDSIKGVVKDYTVIP